MKIALDYDRRIRYAIFQLLEVRQILFCCTALLKQPGVNPVRVKFPGPLFFHFRLDVFFFPNIFCQFFAQTSSVMPFFLGESPFPF
jgi:hypothetical protein